MQTIFAELNLIVCLQAQCGLNWSKSNRHLGYRCMYLYSTSQLYIPCKHGPEPRWRTFQHVLFVDTSVNGVGASGLEPPPFLGFHPHLEGYSPPPPFVADNKLILRLTLIESVFAKHSCNQYFCDKIGDIFSIENQ